MGVDITAKTAIARPRAEVAAFATNPEHDTEWIGGIKEVQILGDGPVGEGTRVRRVASFLGRRMEYTNVIDSFDADAMLDMHSIEAPFPMRVTYRFDENGAGTTEASIRVQGGGGGFYRIAGPLLGMMVRRNVQGDLKRLKALLEAQA